jgi:predicted RNase H-like HicB family nuclease
VANEAATAFQRFLTRVRRAVRAFESERTETESKWFFTVRVEQDETDGGFVAECIDVPGAMSQGETVDEALANVADAIACVIAARLATQLPATPPTSGDSHIQERRVAMLTP